MTTLSRLDHDIRADPDRLGDFHQGVFRARRLSIGAFVGTIMAANVFAVIVPGQRKVVAQLLRGETPEAKYGDVGKQRSTHNNYLTLPVLLMMVSQHYPFLFSHPQPWLVVALIIISGGLVRHVLNRIEAHDTYDKTWTHWALPIAAVALLAAIFITAPKAVNTSGPVADLDALSITQKHCAMCHARKPTHPAFDQPPKNVTLETVDDLKRYAQQINAQAVQNRHATRQSDWHDR